MMHLNDYIYLVRTAVHALMINYTNEAASSKAYVYQFTI